MGYNLLSVVWWYFSYDFVKALPLFFFQIDKLFAMTVSFFEKPLEVKKRYPIPIEGMYGWMGMGTEMYVILLLLTSSFCCTKLNTQYTHYAHSFQ